MEIGLQVVHVLIPPFPAKTRSDRRTCLALDHAPSAHENKHDQGIEKVPVICRVGLATAPSSEAENLYEDDGEEDEENNPKQQQLQNGRETRSGTRIVKIDSQEYWPSYITTYMEVLKSWLSPLFFWTSLNAMHTKKSFCNCSTAKFLDPRTIGTVVAKLPATTKTSNKFQPLARKLRNPRPVMRTVMSTA